MGFQRRQERREERQEDRGLGRGRADGNHVYQMREKLISFGDDFYIERDGQRAFHVDGKALRLRQTLVFKDMQGNELCKIQERVARIKESMEIEGPHGERMAMVKKALITPLRERWVAKIGNGPDLDVQGNILDHEYTISEGRNKVAEVSKRWFRIRDTYGVEIEPGQNDILILALTVAIDAMQ